MPIKDIILVVQWWALFAIIGILFTPITSYIFPKLFDKGYVFAKVIGIITVSYLVFIFGLLHIFPFTRINIVIILLLAYILSLIPNILKKRNNLRLNSIKEILPIFIFEEILFFLGLFFWSFIRAHQPDIQGLEKFMDFGFVNSILRSEYFPPKDMWFTPLSINYYYFGHFITAVATKLSGIQPQITYNLMIATLFSLTFTCTFSIGYNLYLSLANKLNMKYVRIGIITGLITAILVTFAGNLHVIYTLFSTYSAENPQTPWQLVFSPGNFPNNYWYPNATRFIYNTIHEFPLYSFVVSDLHGHVLDIPIVLTIIAVLFHELIQSTTRVSINKILLMSFLLAIAYMTNAWDGIIYFLLTALVLLYLAIQHNNAPEEMKNSMKIGNLKLKIYRSLFYLSIIGIGFSIFSIPFSLHFKPFASGIGVLCAPEILTNIGRLGPFLFEQNHCQRSPLWQLTILYGFFYFFVFSFFFFLRKKKNPPSPDTFILILIFLSTLLIIIPEFIYLKDIYPAHYRANTMFKLVYQSFIMLSIASGYIMIRIVSDIKFKINYLLSFVFFIFSILVFILVTTYPTLAIYSYYGDLKSYRGLDGTTYLNRLYSTDYQAIRWLNENIKNQPVILEAQGDSYTDYARVSANTGLPTVLGWTVHEWLWRGTYDIPAPRVDDVKILYEAEDINQTKNLIKKYNISLIFVGDLERQKYSSLNEKKFETLGKVIYQKDQTKIYKIY